MYDLIKNNAQNITINYSVRSGASNTNGIYTTTKTDSGVPVYFYRGQVDNNIIFGGFCWKIVRTTETKGVKLIYNGLPSNETCNNNTVDNSHIGKSAYNSSYIDNAHVGYMYGTPGSSTYAATHANINDSTIKTYVDNWYKNNLLSYENYIEDTVYCNDRNTTSGTNSTLNTEHSSTYGTLGYGDNKTAYAASSRASYYATSANPTLVCKNTQGSVPSNNDAFTVSSSLGNGKLTYPVGLITADEVVFAGMIGLKMNPSNYFDNTNYLYTGGGYSTMTPDYYSLACVVFIASYVSGNMVTPSNGVRPVISLKDGIKVSSDGTGTLENPYVVETN